MSYVFFHNLVDKCLDIKETKMFLCSTFKMKDFRQVYTILGIKIKRDNGSYLLSKSHYVKILINKFKHLN